VGVVVVIGDEVFYELLFCVVDFVLLEVKCGVDYVW